MPPYAELAQLTRHADYQAHIAQTDYFVLRHLQRFIAGELRQHVTPHQRVADIGCGAQPWRRHIEASAGRYVGVDVVNNQQQTVTLLASAVALPLATGSCEVVLCSEVLEHVADGLAVVQELGRLLTRGGWLLLTAPFIYPLHEEPYDFSRLTPHQLRVYAQQTGLQIVRLELTGNEVEVLATIWSNLWTRLWPGPSISRPRKFLRRLMIMSGNVPAALLSWLVGRYLPCKAGLSVVCVLRKSDQGGGSG